MGTESITFSPPLNQQSYVLNYLSAADMVVQLDNLTQHSVSKFNISTNMTLLITPNENFDLSLCTMLESKLEPPTGHSNFTIAICIHESTNFGFTSPSQSTENIEMAYRESNLIAIAKLFVLLIDYRH